MMRIIYKGEKIREEKYTIVCISKQICPFSWGRYIVLSESDYRQNPDIILTHEAIHIGKKHSPDLLFAELFILFHWFNPVAWLLKRELQDVHEYEADNGVINQGIDATKYQLMLVKKAVGARSYAIANSLNHSKIKIKNRITMMLKEKSTQWAQFKLLLFAPFAAVLLLAFARPETVLIQESLIDSEETTIFEELKQLEEKPEDLQQEKSLVRKKVAAVFKNDTVESSKLLNKEELELNIERIKSQIETASIFEDSYFNDVSFSYGIDNFKKQYDLIKSNPDAFKQSQKERIKQTELRLKEQQRKIEKRQIEKKKTAEKRSKELEKRQKERIKQAEIRLKELEKRKIERIKQTEQRLKALEKKQQERIKQAEIRLKQLQNQI